MKCFLLIYLTVLLSGLAQAQATGAGRITGHVTSNKSLPLELVSVSLLELQKGTLTDEQGHYSFNNLEPGHYTIKIQLLGAAEKDIQVDVAAGQTVDASYQLPTENIHSLQEVTVSGTSNKFS